MGFLNSPQASMGAQAIPGILSGVGGLQQGNYAAAIAQNNAALARQNAESAVQAGQYNASVAKMRGSEVAAQQEAAQGANNIDTNVGSAAAVRASTQQISAMDAAMIQYNAARQAYGFQTQANTEDTQAKLDKQAGQNALLTGVAKATSSYLTSQSAFAPSVVSSGKAVSSKWAGYPQAGTAV